MRTLGRIGLIALALAVTVAIAGCGSDEDETTAATTSTNPPGCPGSEDEIGPLSCQEPMTGHGFFLSKQTYELY